MKNTQMFFAFTLALFFTSCGGFFGTKITDQKGIDKNLKPEYSKFIPEDATITSINFSTGSSGTFSKEIGSATFTYFKKGSEKQVSRYISFGGEVTANDEKEDLVSSISSSVNKMGLSVSKQSRGVNQSSKNIGIKLADVDFSKIASNVEKAAKILADQDKEFSGYDSYEIILNEDPAEVIHRFTLQSSIDTSTIRKSKGRRGLAVEYQYEVYEFRANADGNVALVEN